MITYLKQLSHRRLLCFSALLSLLLSLLEFLPHSPLNSDGMWYVFVAHLYAESGWAMAMKAYPWPFLSAFAVILSKLTFLSILHSFYLITFLSQALMVIAFIELLRVLGASENCQRWGALVILIYPYLNSIRMTITRDFSYWGFGLLGFIFFIRFIQASRKRDAIFFGLSFLIATLFRIEGGYLLLLLPFAICFLPHRNFWQKCRDYLWANFFVLLGILGLVFLYALHPHAFEASRLGEMQAQLTQVIPHTLAHLKGDATKIRLAILNNVSAGNEMTILLGGLAAIFTLTIISTFKPLYFLLAIYAQCKSFMLNPKGEVYALTWFIFINLILLAVFILERYFSAPRYAVFLVLIWMLWTPFALEKLQGHKIFPLILFILLVMALGGIVRFGYSKHYLTEAGDWVYSNTDSSAHIYTNSREIHFYGSNAYENRMRRENITEADQNDPRSWNPEDYDWIVLRVNHGETLTPSMESFVKHHQAIKTFSNKRHDQVLIYDEL